MSRFSGDTTSAGQLAFLVTNQYQVRHYAPIVRALPIDPTFVVEIRDQDLGVDPDFIHSHFPGAEVMVVPKTELRSLDGRFRVIVCQTPVLPQVLLDQTLVVCQQYSLAKEAYQYGVWRSLAALNLMYGAHSLERVEGFAPARAVGHPMFDEFFQNGLPSAPSTDAPARGLYLPTYGSLSSVPVVAEHLTTIDAEVTVKLHHMEDPGLAASLPASCQVLRSDVDPVELLAHADFVISDFSGAAFDALYARRPLLLAGAADATASDFHRLSKADLDRDLLSDLAARWVPGQPLRDAVAEAQERLSDDRAYEAFIDRFFVNHGAASQSAADAIMDVLERGEVMTFAQRQVRERNRSLIERNRELNTDNRLLKQANNRLRSRSGRALHRVVAPLAKRARPLVARARPVERAAVAVKQRVTKQRATRRLVGELDRVQPVPDPRYGVAVADRRDSLLNALLKALEPTSAQVASAEVDGIAAVALFNADKPHLVSALRSMGSDDERLVLRRSVDEVNSSVKARDAVLGDIYSAKSLQLVSALMPGSPTPSDVSLGVYFVEEVAEKGRVLALNPRAPKVDWTAHLGDTRSQAGPIEVLSARHSVKEIDLVYTWVDSSDPDWRRDYERTSPDGDLPASAGNAERWLSRDELRYSLRSVWMFAPMIRHIYVVTADQVPEWLDLGNERISVVSHKEIFPDPEDLPTFNSHAIEASLHRIPGLGEHFVYMNDDFFLGREVTPDDFYTRAGLSKVRFAPSQFVYEGEPEPGAIPTDWAAYRCSHLVQERFGLRFDRKLQHVPYALRRSVIETIESEHPQQVALTRSSRFRDRNDLAIPSMLAHFYGVASGAAVEWPTGGDDDYVYADTGRQDYRERFATILAKRPMFFCLNSTMHRQVSLEDQAEAVQELLRALYPYPSPFEKRNSG